MPTGSPVARQPDRGPSEINPSANWLRSAVARWALGTSAIVFLLALCASPALAAPSMTAITVSGVRHEVIWPILCGTAGILAFLMLRAIVRLARAAVARSSNRKRNGDLPATSIEQFVEEAQRLYINPQIAHETFQLLVSLVPAGSTISANDELRGSLRLSDQQIGSLLSALPELCDRSRQPADAATVLSVYDLLHHIESSPKSASGQSPIRNGAIVPAVPASPTSPLADLKNALPRDSRFRTRAHFSGVKRRASDYSGPYRRATDRRPDENYTGPLRRASDRQDVSGTGSAPRTDDRRSSERRAVVPQETSEPARQHRAVSADTSLLNQCLNASSKQGGGEQDRDRIAPAMAREGVLVAAAPLQQR
jgi:hypothetical protein